MKQSVAASAVKELHDEILVLRAELARRDEERADLLDKNNKLHGYYAEQVNKRVCLEGELRHRDEIIKRLIRAGNNLIQLANFGNKKAVEYTDAWDALMKELEEK